MDLHEQKAQLRKQLKQQRNALSRKERQEKDRLIQEKLAGLDAIRAAKSAFCYVSYLSEVETHSILDRLLERQVRVAVPKIIDATCMLSVPFNGWADLEPDAMGILTPTTAEKDDGPFDIALTPGLGFTLRGERLGYGRGYYDRWLDRHNVGTRIGLCFEVQIVDSLPVEDTDMPLDLLVTEQQVYDFRS